MSNTAPDEPNGPGTRLDTTTHDPDRPWWHLNVASDAFFYAVVGRIAHHIQLQPDRRAALRRTVREIYKAVANPNGGEQ